MPNKILYKIKEILFPLILSIIIVIGLPIGAIYLDRVFPNIIITIPTNERKIVEYSGDFPKEENISINQKAISYLILNNNLFRK